MIAGTPASRAGGRQQPEAGNRATPGAAQVRVILNPKAGRKAGVPTNRSPAAADVHALFSALGVPVDVRVTDSEEQAIAVTRSAVADRCTALVAAGGDGTVGAVARTLVAESIEREGSTLPALGVLPLGSAMNVARSLEIPRDLAGAAEIIAEGHPRGLDIGLTERGETFLEGIAVGLHAELFAGVAALEQGELLAPLRAAWSAVRYRPSRMTIVLDDRTVRTRALVVSVSNGPYVGLGFTVAPDARLDDGRFDIRVFERFSRMELVRHFGSIALGRRAYEPRVRTFRSGHVRVESASPVRVRIDGRDAGDTPVDAVVRPAAIQVLVPRPAHAAPPGS